MVGDDEGARTPPPPPPHAVTAAAARTPMAARLQSPPPFPLGSNDDQLERARARAARAAASLRRGTTTTAASSAFAAAQYPLHSSNLLNRDQIMDLFHNCIKLASENKINQKNTWELRLIDHLSEIIKARSEDEGDDETNFQKASCTLEAGVKIYSARVDSVHSEAYKVLGGINRAGREQEKVTEAVGGSHKFKISGYSLIKGIDPGKFYESATFTVGDFDWAIRYYPGGALKEDADYISLYVVLACEARDVKARFKIALLDHREKPSSMTTTECELRCFSGRGRGRGFRRFMTKANLEASQYLKDDCFTVKATVNVMKEPRLEVPTVRSVPPPPPPPSDLHQHLVQLLESGEGTDVTFEVGGETFAAHRWLLAARSPVFKAELLGPMKEKTMQCINIQDMESVVFKALLHFIYSDSVSDFTEDQLISKESPADLMAQHLLAAADRYGLERLRLICEDKLCEQVDVSTVATTLALAEQHHCNQLKAACLEFVASPEILIAVMLTDGFEHLKKSCPPVLNDLLDKFGCPSIPKAKIER